MAVLVIALITSVIASIILYLRTHYSYWAYRNVPHEPPLYFLGNMLGISKSLHFKDINRRVYNKFKGAAPFAGFYFFLSRTAFILDLDLIKYILIKDFANFKERGIFNNVRDDPLTGHLLTLEGHAWKLMRNKLSPVFTSGKIKFMFPTVVEVGKHFAEVCGALLRDEGPVVEVKDLSARYTTDVIGSCAFGIECNSLQDPNAEFRQMGKAIFDRPRHSQFVQAFMIGNANLARKMRMKFFTDEVSDFFIGIVRRTVEYREKSAVQRNDFMNLLVEIKAESYITGTDPNDLSNGLTIEQLAAQAFVFFLAGFETSSTTMAFCLYELAKDQKIQDKLRSEILTILAKHNNELTYECMKEMHYMEQVIAETLRMYSVIPHIFRKTLANYKVPNTDYVLEKGTMILIPVDAIHHDPDYYPQPEVFDPERFSPEAINERHSEAYLPFGDGPRNCIGLRFGKMQTYVGLISLLKEFRFCVSDKTQIPMKFSTRNFPISAEGGIHLKIERIKVGCN